MANLLSFTEQFNDAYWSAFDSLTVTANTHAAPAFAGGTAGLADTLDDPGASPGSLFGTYVGISDGTQDYVASLYVRKDATTTRFPAIGMQFTNGDPQLFPQITVNTSTGAIVALDADASGVVDVDATWWRFWFRKANNNLGNTAVRLYFYPAYSQTIGGGLDGGTTGSAIIWGAQLEQASAVGTYQASPAYATAALTGTALGGISETNIVSGGRTIIITLTGDTWRPA